MPLQVLNCCHIQAIAYEVTSKVPLQRNNLHKSSYATACVCVCYVKREF